MKFLHLSVLIFTFIGANAPAQADPPAGTHSVDPSNAYFKPGKGLYLNSQDGQFSIAPRLRIQMRHEYTADHAEESDTVHTHGLLLRRARLQFVGHMFGKHNKYKAEFGLSPRDVGLKGSPTRSPVLTWYAEFDHLSDLTLRIGQYKIPYSRQRVISSGNLELVDRTLANGEFNLDRDIGFDFRSKDLAGLDLMRYYVGVYMGEGRDATGQVDAEGEGAGLMYLARVEFLPFGIFKDYSEADLKRSDKLRLSVGLGYAYIFEAQRNRGVLGSTPTDGGTVDYRNLNADVVMMWSGLSVFGEFYWRDGFRNLGDMRVDPDTGADLREKPRNGYGWTLQAGYLLPQRDVQVAARYSTVRAAQKRTSLSDTQEAGGGVSYYFGGHAYKLQADYFRKWGEDAARGSDNVRVQLQLAY